MKKNNLNEKKQRSSSAFRAISSKCQKLAQSIVWPTIQSLFRQKSYLGWFKSYWYLVQRRLISALLVQRFCMTLFFQNVPPCNFKHKNALVFVAMITIALCTNTNAHIQALSMADACWGYSVWVGSRPALHPHQSAVCIKRNSSLKEMYDKTCQLRETNPVTDFHCRWLIPTTMGIGFLHRLLWNTVWKLILCLI